MADTKSPLVRPRLIAGILVFLLGGVFLADQVGGVSAESARALWPIGIVAVGLVVVMQRDTVGRLVGALHLVVGIWLLCNNLGWWGYSFWDTWPYLPVAFGAWMLYRVNLLREREGPPGAGLGTAGRFDQRVTDSPAVGALSFLNGVERVASGSRLENGDFHSVLGACDVDLSDAGGIDGAVIDTFAVLGSVGITVPPGCKVDNRVLPLLGRVDNACGDATGGAGTVVVRGVSLLGRVTMAGPADTAK